MFLYKEASLFLSYRSHVWSLGVLQSARRKKLGGKRERNLCKFPQRTTENQPVLTASIFCCSHWLVSNWFPVRGFQSGVSVPGTRTQLIPRGTAEFLIDGWASCSWLNSLLNMSGLMLPLREKKKLPSELPCRREGFLSDSQTAGNVCVPWTRNNPEIVKVSQWLRWFRRRRRWLKRPGLRRRDALDPADFYCWVHVAPCFYVLRPKYQSSR